MIYVISFFFYCDKQITHHIWTSTLLKILVSLAPIDSNGRACDIYLIFETLLRFNLKPQFIFLNVGFDFEYRLWLYRKMILELAKLAPPTLNPSWSICFQETLPPFLLEAWQKDVHWWLHSRFSNHCFTLKPHNIRKYMPDDLHVISHIYESWKLDVGRIRILVSKIQLVYKNFSQNERMNRNYLEWSKKKWD